MTMRFCFSTVLISALAASGCRMCCPSYDYCGPTNPGESQSICCGMARQGSILSGQSYEGEQVVYEDGTVIEGDTQLPTPNLAPPSVAPEPEVPEPSKTPPPNVVPPPAIPKSRSAQLQQPTLAPPMVKRPVPSTPTKISSRRGA